METKILGVCFWIAEKTNINVTAIRIAFVVATIFGLGAPVLLYIILYFLLRLNLLE